MDHLQLADLLAVAPDDLGQVLTPRQGTFIPAVVSSLLCYYFIKCLFCGKIIWVHNDL